MSARHRWSLPVSGKLWRPHPAVRTGDDLTPGERAADALRNAMGSWAFVIGALLSLAGWMALQELHSTLIADKA